MKNIGIILILSAWAFTIIVLVIRNADDNKAAEQQRQESEAIWTVSGPFCEVQAFAGTKYFLLDHPQLGRRKISSGEIKFSGEIPVAVQRGVAGTFHPVLWKYPTTQPAS